MGHVAVKEAVLPFDKVGWCMLTLSNLRRKQLELSD